MSDAGDVDMHDALERATQNLQAAGEELEATLHLLEERTERMHACDAMLHAVLAESDEIFIGIDADGRIEAWSRGADDHFDQAAEAALGKRIGDFLAADDAGLVLAAVRSALAGESGDGEDVRVVRTEGAVFRVRRSTDGSRGLVVVELAD